MTPYEASWKNRAVSPDEAARLVPNGARVFIQGAAATPTTITEALARRQDVLGVRLYHLHVEGEFGFVKPNAAGRFTSISFFASPSTRAPIAEGRADFVPVFLSDIPGLFSSGAIPLDVAMVQLSPPDRHGLCTLGTSVDATRAAVDSAKIVIAEINEQVPRTHGRTAVHIDEVTAFTLTNRPLHAHAPAEMSDVETEIGRAIAELVDDGACLQMGIGAIPDAVLARLGTKNDLGIHTEMFSDRVVDLARSGVITNNRKKVFAGRISTSFVAGSQKVFDFVDDNPLVEFHPSDKTNDTALIASNDNVTAINSALAVDLSGQVCADSIGHRIYSGIGGQMDFVRGAAQSKGGKPILAFPSTASNGKVSRVVMELIPGSGVVTTRGHVHWIVTEYGAVNLHGKSLRERADLLISTAHPDFRGDLKREFARVRHFTFG